MSDRTVTTLEIDADTSSVADFERAMASAERVNEQVAAASRDLALAISGVDAGMRAQLNSADDATRNHNLLGDAARYAARSMIEVNAGALLAYGAVGAATVAFGRLLGILGPIYLGIKGVEAVFDTMSYATELAKKQIEDYSGIANKAAAAGFSPEFLQRLSKSAEAAKQPIDDLTEAVKKFNDVSKDKLGGNDLDGRIQASVKAGNFAGNTGVDALRGASTSEERLRATVSLIDQALAKGERLAALDIADKAFGSKTAAALSADSGYLDQMLKRADDISKTQLISDAEIGRAIDLKTRMEDAEKVLSGKWKPIQDDLATLGMNYQRSWVEIYETMAKVVDQATTLYNIVKGFPDWWARAAGGASIWSTITNATTTPEGRKASEAQHGISTDPRDIAMVGANAQLTAALQNRNNVTAAMKDATDTYTRVLGDNSHAINDNNQRQREANDLVDRSIITLLRHVESQKADAAAIGLGDGALARFRAEAAQTAAIQANGGKITADQVAQFEKLKIEAYDTADALARMRVAGQIDFAQKTLFLSPQDLQIAQQLRGIYGNDVPRALASTEAAQLRVINGIRDARDIATDFSKSFIQGLVQGKSAMEALVGAADQLAAKMADKALTDLFSGNFAQAAVEGAVAIGASLFSSDQKAKKELADAQAAWAKMAGQVEDFNRAAAGFDLGQLSQELRSLITNFQDLQKAAAKAHDINSQYQLADTFSKGVNRLVDEFAAGTNTLTPLQQAMKAVTDDAAGLKDQIAAVITSANGLSGLDVKIDAAAAARIKALVSNFTDQLTSGLAARLNTATGKSYLNDVADLVKQHQKDLADAAALGNDPAILSQIATVFSAEAQKIVSDAGLVGDRFRDFIALFPQLGDVVSQATVDVTSSIKSINKYLEDLGLGSNSILSPQDQLALAQGNFNRQIGLAQGGDADALSSITSYAQTFLDQAKSFYSSTAGYTDIFRTVTASLAGLTGTSVSAGSTPQAALAGLPSPILPQLAQSRSTASNDNGQYFSQQTQTLVQAMASTASAEIAAIREEGTALRADVGRLIRAVEDGNRTRPSRPGQRATA